MESFNDATNDEYEESSFDTFNELLDSSYNGETVYCSSINDNEINYETNDNDFNSIDINDVNQKIAQEAKNFYYNSGVIVPSEQTELIKEFKVNTNLIATESEIRDFIHRFPNSFILIPTAETGILRLTRNTKKGIRCNLIPVLKDLLNNLNQ